MYKNNNTSVYYTKTVRKNLTQLHFLSVPLVLLAQPDRGINERYTSSSASPLANTDSVINFVYIMIILYTYIYVYYISLTIRRLLAYIYI